MHHFVMEPEEYGTAGKIHWTSDPHPLCAKIRDGSDLVLDYIHDDHGYRDGESCGDEITDADTLDMISEVESLPWIYKTDTGVSLHRGQDTYYLGYHIGNRHLWYVVDSQYNQDLDTLLADCYAQMYAESSEVAKKYLQSDLQTAGLWELVSQRLRQ